MGNHVQYGDVIQNRWYIIMDREVSPVWDPQCSKETRDRLYGNQSSEQYVNGGYVSKENQWFIY